MTRRVLASYVLIPALAGCVARAPAQSPAAKTTPTAEQAAEQTVEQAENPAADPVDNELMYGAWTAFEHESMRASYLADEARDRSFDEAALELFEFSARTLTGDWDSPGFDEVLEKAEALVNAGCESPMEFGVYAAATNSVYPRSGNAAAALDMASSMMTLDACPAHRVAMARLAYAKLIEHFGHADDLAPYFVPGLEALVRSLEDVSGDAMAERYLLAKCEVWLDDDKLPAAHVDDLARLVNDSDSISTWLREMVLAECANRRAWDARGRGFAHTVDEDEWRAFRAHISVAHEHVHRAMKADPTRPEPASMMITFAMAGQTEESERFWFDEALRRQPDWVFAYTAYRFSLRPRWGGSTEAVLDFGMWCAETGKDKYVLEAFLWAVRDVCVDRDDWQDVWRDPEIYIPAKRVLERLLDDATHARRQREVQSRLAAIAWRAQDYETAWRHRTALGDEFDVSEMSFVNGTITDLDVECGPLASGAASAFWTAQLLEEDGDFERASEAYRAAIDDLDADERTSIAPLIEHAAAKIEFQLAFDAGEWASMHGAQGWRAWRGTWRATEGEGWCVRAESTSADPTAILDAHLGARYEIRCTVDASNGPGYMSNNGAVIVGFNDSLRSPRYMRAFVYPGERRAGYGTSSAIDMKRVFCDERFDLEVAVWDGRLALRVDGTPICAGEFRRSRPHAGSAGLGEIVAHPWDGHVDFLNIEIRRLDERPAELD